MKNKHFIYVIIGLFICSFTSLIDGRLIEIPDWARLLLLAIAAFCYTTYLIKCYKDKKEKRNAK